MDGFVMTVVECAKRIMEKDWKGIKEIDIKTLGYAMIMVETIQQND